MSESNYKERVVKLQRARRRAKEIRHSRIERLVQGERIVDVMPFMI